MDLQLNELYKGGTYNFQLCLTTIKNIIDKWTSNSNKFKKYSALDLTKNKNGELILWKYEHFILYTKDKSNPIETEYFIWSCIAMIARGRESY